MGFLLALLVAALPEVNLSLLRPASGSDGLLGVEGARPPTDGSEPLQLQIGLDFGYKPIRVGLDGVSHESRSGGWVQLAAPLNGYASIFAQLPVTLGQSATVAQGAGAATPSFGFTVGDIRAGVRHGFLRGPIDVAGQLAVEVASGAHQSLTDDQRLVVEALVAAARRRGQLELIGNAFLRFRPPHDVGTVKLGNEIGLRGGAAWWLSTRSRVYGELELQSSLRDLSQQSFPIEWRLGATLCAGSAIAADVAGGTRLDNGLGAPSVRGVVAVRYAPSLCTPPKRETGPEPGLKELVAQIAKERAEREKAEQEKRIPKLIEASESAARETLIRSQAADLLPTSEGQAAARATTYGEEQTRDTDGDGVPDAVDNCPLVKGPADNAGCPRAEKQIVTIRENRIEILDKVYFAPGKTLIHPRSTRLLNQIARVLKTHPEVVRIDVQGHTDSTGGLARNLALSQARAEAVVGALIRRGVAANRMVAHGFGPNQPIATNATRQGREKNRRVEFRVIQRRVAGEVTDVAP
ncbi:MAG TPA: OmpA family protein [Myxococcales bacterium]|nr:OmpA family protein [Myxococcales bacterium]